MPFQEYTDPFFHLKEKLNVRIYKCKRADAGMKTVSRMKLQVARRESYNAL